MQEATMSGVFIASDVLRSLSVEVRTAIFHAIAAPLELPTTAPEEEEKDEAIPGVVASLNDREVAQLLRKPISLTGRRILEEVANEPAPRFRVGDVLDRLGMERGELTGA